MAIICLLPAIISSLIIFAHFYRMGSSVLIVAALLLPLFLFIRRRWALRTVQAYLLVGAVEWIRALFVFIEIYERAGMSWTRLAVILGAVILFTLCSALLLFCRPLNKRYPA